MTHTPNTSADESATVNRYHFEVRCAAPRYGTETVYHPAYYAATLEAAEGQARRSYPSALRVILQDVTFDASYYATRGVA
jgi:hypothetical protein